MNNGRCGSSQLVGDGGSNWQSCCSFEKNRICYKTALILICLINGRFGFVSCGTSGMKDLSVSLGVPGDNVSAPLASVISIQRASVLGSNLAEHSTVV